MLEDTLFPSREMMMWERILEVYQRNGNTVEVTVSFLHMLYKEMKGKLSSTLSAAEVMGATRSVLDTPLPNISDLKMDTKWKQLWHVDW